MAGELISLSWRPRPEPLAARAAVGLGPVAGNLARRLLALRAEQLARLSAVAGDGLLAVLGDTADLPWVDGAVYLGPPEAAPGLWIPTCLAPSVPEALLERAIRSRFPALAPPFAVLPGAGVLASLAAALPISRAVLLASPLAPPGAAP